MRIAFVHTVGFLVDRFRELMQEQHPDADSFHILNEGVLQDLLRGQSGSGVYRRVVEQVALAVDGGAELVTTTCSSISPAVDIAHLQEGLQRDVGKLILASPGLLMQELGRRL